MRYIHYLISLGLGYSTFAQSEASFLWSTQFQEADQPGVVGAVAAMDTTLDGGLFVSGSLPNKVGVYVRRLSPDGDILWTEEYNSLNQSNHTSDLRSLLDGGFVIAGKWNCPDMSGNPGRIVKFNGDGDIVWQNCYPQTSDITSILQTFDGGFILLGTTASVSWRRPILLKVDPLGEVEWSQAYGEGYGHINAGSLEAASDGGYVFTAIFNPPFETTELWVLKVNVDGDLEWQNAYGGSQYEDGGVVYPVAGGGYMVIAETWSSDGDVVMNHGYGDILVLKLDQAGTVISSYSYGGPGNERFVNAARTSDGGFVVTCQTTGNGGDVTGFHGGSWDIWVLKLDPNGLLQWQRCFGGSSIDSARDIIQRSDGSVAILSRTHSTDGDLTGTGTQWVTAFNMIGIDTGFDGSSMDASLTIYPNPTSGIVTIDIELTEPANLGTTMFDSTGQLVKDLPVWNGVPGINRFPIPCEDLPIGVYFLKMEIGESIVTRRVVKL